MAAIHKTYPNKKSSFYYRVLLVLFALALAAGVLAPSHGAHANQISFVQTNSRDSGDASTSNAFAFNSNNTAGNLIVAVVNWGTATSATSSITDSPGNVYTSAIGPINQAGGGGTYVQIFYAKNIAGGANTVTVKPRMESSCRYRRPRFCDLETAELRDGVVLLEDGPPAAEGFVSIK
jgi:hypothetical protein